MTQALYDEIWADAQQVRGVLNQLMSSSPELFPAELLGGYRLTGRVPVSKKLPGIRLRQIRHEKSVYTLRPSFVMSYMSGTVETLHIHYCCYR
jgi:hypothetical protein